MVRATSLTMKNGEIAVVVGRVMTFSHGVAACNRDRQGPDRTSTFLLGVHPLVRSRQLDGDVREENMSRATVRRPAMVR
jgi:hypothetical protein